jgi:hypothetical protein
MPCSTGAKDITRDNKNTFFLKESLRKGGCIKSGVLNIRECIKGPTWKLTRNTNPV